MNPGDAMSCSRFAPAKVNLYLHVTGRRADGYHLLDSLVVFAGVGDRLGFAESDQLTLTLSGPSSSHLAVEPDNIVLKAARLLAAHLGRAPAAAITLEKNLPVAAGIGGGSADAAATLRGLAQLWRAALSEDELQRIGLALGADLPVCLAGRATQMSGIGEVLAPALPLPAAWLVLVNPRLALPTPAVFKARQGDFSAAAPLTRSPKNAIELAEWLRKRGNDLAPPAMRLEPAVGQMLAALERSEDCLLARMSGSGATCFGLYGSATEARKAEAELQRNHPGWWVAAAEILP